MNIAPDSTFHWRIRVETNVHCYFKSLIPAAILSTVS